MFHSFGLVQSDRQHNMWAHEKKKSNARKTVKHLTLKR